VIVDGIEVGFPAGVALDRAETTLYVSGHDGATGNDAVFAIDLASKMITTYSMGISMNSDAGGVHRGRSSDVLSWADLTAGGKGEVYRIEIK
jgi:hypothetical protein